MLSATLHKRLGGFELTASLEAEPGTTLVLVGESGAGKTSVLRLLAGLERPDEGRIVLEGVTWFDEARGLFVPPWDRAIGYLGQDYVLFPHLSVFDNVAFGLRTRRLPKSAIRAKAADALEQLGIADLADRRPDQLSGGQRQRVALARTLALEPRLLLLDEPLSAVDLQTRRTVARELRRVLTQLSCVTIYVTHHPIEALTFGDRISVIEAGRVSQTDTAEVLLRRPRSPYAAELLGVNLFRGTIRAGDPTTVVTDSGAIAVAGVESEAGGEPDGEVWLAVNPRHIVLSVEPISTSAQNVFEGKITELIPEPPMGERVRVVLATTPPLVAEVSEHAVTELGLRPGLEVFAAFKATGVTVYR